MGGRYLAAVCLAAIAVTAPACGPPRDPMRALVEAVGAQRLLEPRLTGGFAYAPCSPSAPASETAVVGTEAAIVRAKCSGLPAAGSASWKKLAEAARAVDRWRSTSHPPAAALAATGAVNLIAGTAAGVERAVKTLESAAEESHDDPRILSDLAAAYLVRAGHRQDPADLVQALETIERALVASPRLPEALFNRALVLEWLCLRGQAADAWREVRSREPGSGWSAEAQSHLAALARLPSVEFGAAERDALRAAARRREKTEVLRLVALSPQAAREYAMEDVLARWGTLFRQGDRVGAADALEKAGAIGAALRALHGDQTVAGAVAAAERAALSSSDPAPGLALAGAHVAYARGGRLAHELSLEKARPELLEARSAFSSNGSPMAFWAASALGGIELYAGRYENGLRLFEGVVRQADSLVYPAVQGRVRWGLAMIRGRQGRFSESLAGFETAGAAFRRALEMRNQASIQNLIAEMRSSLGQPDLAWRHRYAALAIHSDAQASRQLDNLLFEGASALLTESRPRAALDFANEGVGVARRSGQASMIAEDLLQRSRIRAGLGQTGPAFADLAGARSFSSREESRTTRERVLPDIDRMQGEMRVESDPRLALYLLTGAMQAYLAQNRPVDAGRAMWSRARALIAQGAAGAAEAQLREAVDLFFRQRTAIADPALRVTYSETMQGLFDEMIQLQAGALRRPGRAFEYSDLARSIPPGEATAAAPRAGPYPTAPAPARETSEVRLAEVPEGIALVEFSITGHHLFTWFVIHGTVAASERRIEPKELERAIQTFLLHVRRGDERGIAAASAALYPMLVPPEVARLPADVGLVFVPDKSLNAVPFAALRCPATGRYLIEDRCLTVAPSVSSYRSILERGRTVGSRRGWTSLLVGAPAFDVSLFPQLPPLPGAMAETAELRRLYPGAKVLSGPAADRSRVLAEIDRHEIFSFAGHAVDNPRVPADSYLVLAPSRAGPADDGMLFAREVSSLRLGRLRLVILSACRTEATASSRTAGITGLARPFLDAGAAAVLGTLWAVDDESASRLLPEFHRRFASGLGTASALRAAQLAMLHSENEYLRSPANWAAFQLVGDIR